LLLGKARVAAALDKYGLKFMAKVYSSGHVGSIPSENPKALANAEFPHPKQGKTAEEHIAVWSAQIREACVPILRPYLLGAGSQGGRDMWEASDVDKFVAAGLALSEEFGGLAIHHETHRHRILFNPWDAVRTVRRNPQMRLLADLSHYCVVCECNPDNDDLDAAVQELLPNVGHVHFRVGFPEGPQVPDPSEARFKEAFEGHKRWWLQIFRLAVRAGRPVITATPEFLPPPYAWTVPEGSEAAAKGPNAASADFHSINHQMAGLAKELFAEALRLEGKA
jgi:sugar phosphate isomerase/epimerase